MKYIIYKNDLNDYCTYRADQHPGPDWRPISLPLEKETAERIAASFAKAEVKA